MLLLREIFVSIRRVERRTSFGNILNFLAYSKSVVESTPPHHSRDINLRKLSIIKLTLKNSQSDTNLQKTTLICELRHLICECTTIGMTGFEPAAPSSRTKCATKLRYIPSQKWHCKLRISQPVQNDRITSSIYDRFIQGFACYD